MAVVQLYGSYIRHKTPDVIHTFIRLVRARSYFQNKNLDLEIDLIQIYQKSGQLQSIINLRNENMTGLCRLRTLILK